MSEDSYHEVGIGRMFRGLARKAHTLPLLDRPKAGGSPWAVSPRLYRMALTGAKALSKRNEWSLTLAQQFVARHVGCRDWYQFSNLHKAYQAEVESAAHHGIVFAVSTESSKPIILPGYVEDPRLVFELACDLANVYVGICLADASWFRPM